jgi:hypothetical protein
MGHLLGLSDGNIDFFHTAGLNRVVVSPIVNRVSDDGGALVRNLDGSFSLAPSVSEPPS